MKLFCFGKLKYDKMTSIINSGGGSSKHHRRNQYRVHVCQLETNSYSCLPLISPRRSRIFRWLRSFRKQFIISRRHYEVQASFASITSIIEQRKRHLRTNRHAIHPYSNFMIVYEITMSIMALISLFKDPYLYAFDRNYDYDTYRSSDDGGIASYVILNTIFDVFLMILSLINFIIGYKDKRNLEIVLDGRRIAKRYVTRYFLIDISTLPLHVLFYLNEKRSVGVWYFFRFIIWARIVRMITYESYLRQLTVKLGLNIFGHRVLTFLLWALLMVHWINCLFCLYTKFLIDLKPDLRGSLLLKYDKDRATMHNYVISLYITTTHLYQTGELEIIATDVYEQLFMILVLAIGKCFICIIICQVFGLVRSTISSKAKYESLINELKSYSRLKRLPLVAEARLIKYYRVRFNERYFKETSIMQQLTSTLIKEIKYMTTKSIIDKIPLFKGIPQSSLEELVSNLQENFYLECDVIGRSHTICDGLYIIAYGTCALITDVGVEITHFDDGDHFGVVSMRFYNEMWKNNIVAVTHCLIYKMPKKLFVNCMNKYASFRQIMDEEVDNVKKLLEKRKTHVDNQISIMNQLRNKMILEDMQRRT